MNGETSKGRDYELARTSLDIWISDVREKYPVVPDKRSSSGCESCRVGAVGSSCRWRNLLDDLSVDRGINEDVRAFIINLQKSKNGSSTVHDNACPYGPYISRHPSLRLSDFLRSCSREGNGKAFRTPEMDQTARPDPVGMEERESRQIRGTSYLHEVVPWPGEKGVNTLIRLIVSRLDKRNSEELTWPST